MSDVPLYEHCYHEEQERLPSAVRTSATCPGPGPVLGKRIINSRGQVVTSCIGIEARTIEKDFCILDVQILFGGISSVYYMR